MSDSEAIHNARLAAWREEVAKAIIALSMQGSGPQRKARLQGVDLDLIRRIAGEP